MNKEKPKKIKIRIEEGQIRDSLYRIKSYHCPNCGNCFGADNISDILPIFTVLNYCYWCGQHLDWEGID